MTYRLCKTWIVDEAGHSLVSYGVQTKTQTIEDICLYKKQFQAFVNALNQYRLDPIHLEDAVEDFLLMNCNTVG